MPSEDLFARDSSGSEPLAARMRPRFLDEFVGQQHIIGPGKLLRRAIQADMLSSLIFYGPPGTGKTTLARVIANTTKSSFISLNAVLAGVKDVRESIEKARTNLDMYDKHTILFVDEVHRWNKAQQDALLPWVENGTVVLIGATTHNPFFEVNSALVSRSRIFQLKPLTTEDLYDIARHALTDPVRGYGQFAVEIDNDALDHLVAVADGDARGLLGALQLAVETSVDPYPPEAGTAIRIDRAVAEDSIQRKAVLYDKEGDYHYDVISAFIKSLRGSDPDATLYWMARMVHSGEDPRYIFRRMLILASEDVGLADPGALSVVESAAAAFDRVGMPEGRFHLAQAALYLATCPKSNSTLGFFDALQTIETEQSEEVPNHMRDAGRDKEGFGHGEGYLYPHAYADHWVAQAYLPAGLKGRLFYQPSDQGYEKDVREHVLRLRELQLEVGFADLSQEVLSYSKSGDRELDRWLARTENDRASVLALLRDRALSLAGVQRHHNVLVAGNLASLVLWETMRAAPEGLAVALFTDPRRLETAGHHVSQLNPVSRPVLLDAAKTGLDSLGDAVGETPGHAVPPGGTSSPSDAPTPGEPGSPDDAPPPALAGVRFERIILADAARLAPDWQGIFAALRRVAAPEGELVIVQRIPREGQKLSELVELDDAELQEALREAEGLVYDQSADPVVRLESSDVESAAVEAGWRWGAGESVDVEDPRHIAPGHLSQWFSAEREHGLGSALVELAGEEIRARVEQAVSRQLAGKDLLWRVRFLVATATAGTAAQ